MRVIDKAPWVMKTIKAHASCHSMFCKRVSHCWRGLLHQNGPESFLTISSSDSLSPPISAILILAGPFVHENLFLGDMAAGRTTFCSLLQASAMLTNACVRISVPCRLKCSADEFRKLALANDYGSLNRCQERIQSQTCKRQ